MPFYVSPEQAMKDKADYARKAITRIRSGVVIDCDAGILFIAPNPSRALRKFSEIYDRMAFAAVGRYNEFENLRKAGVRYADLTGFAYARQDVTARGLANYYAQVLGTVFTDSPKPYEVEIVVAEVGKTQDDDEIYRITFDGSVSDEPGFVAFGGQADQVSAALKEAFSDNMSLPQALAAALAALTAPAPAAPAGSGSSASAAVSTAGNGTPTELTASQLEVAILDRARAHRTFRRLQGPRLEELIAESRSAAPAEVATAPEAAPASDDPPTGPSAASGDGIPKPPKAK